MLKLREIRPPPRCPIASRSVDSFLPSGNVIGSANRYASIPGGEPMIGGGESQACALWRAINPGRPTIPKVALKFAVLWRNRHNGLSSRYVDSHRSRPRMSRQLENKLEAVLGIT